MLLIAKAIVKNAPMHRAKRRNLDFAGGHQVRLKLCASPFQLPFGKKRSNVSGRVCSLKSVLELSVFFPPVPKVCPESVPIVKKVSRKRDQKSRKWPKVPKVYQKFRKCTESSKSGPKVSRKWLNIKTLEVKKCKFHIILKNLPFHSFFSSNERKKNEWKVLKMG